MTHLSTKLVGVLYINMRKDTKGPQKKRAHVQRTPKDKVSCPSVWSAIRRYLLCFFFFTQTPPCQETPKQDIWETVIIFLYWSCVVTQLDLYTVYGQPVGLNRGVTRHKAILGHRPSFSVYSWLFTTYILFYVLSWLRWRGGVRTTVYFSIPQRAKSKNQHCTETLGDLMCHRENWCMVH